MYFAIKSLLNKTESCIKINEILSYFFQVCNGVRQGDSILSTLFSLLINDLVKDLNELKIGIQIFNTIICCLFHADDLVLMACNQKDMQKLLNCFGNWCKKWRVKINFDKYSVIHFRNAKKWQSEYTFNIGANKFSYVSYYKYLGLVLDEHLNYDSVIIELSALAKRTLGSVISK